MLTHSRKHADVYFAFAAAAVIGVSLWAGQTFSSLLFLGGWLAGISTVLTINRGAKRLGRAG